MKRILSLYARASGQGVNYHKSSIVVSGSIARTRKERIAEQLGVKLVAAHDKYLGLPAVAGRSRSELFRSIKERFWAKISGWDAKLLSQAEKYVLIKSVLQALAAYVMACFKLPDQLVRSLDAMMADFWWHNRGERQVHWVAWKKLCHSTVGGGLGFRSLKAFNLSLLSKQGLRLLSKPDSLLARVMKARYFPNSSFWEATAGARPSLTWRGILSARHILTWGYQTEANSEGDGGVRIVWRFSRNGCFSVKTAYKQAVELGEQSVASSSRFCPGLPEERSGFWPRLWRLQIPPRVRLFAWRLCWDAVPTMVKLAKRRAGIDTQCRMCGGGEESVQHVMLKCSFACQVWALSNIPWRWIEEWPQSTAAWISGNWEQMGTEDKQWFLMLCWALWQNRNKWVMENTQQEPMQVVRTASSLLVNYKAVRVK